MNRTIKIILSSLLISSLLLLANVPHESAASDTPLYTAYNIWKHKSKNMYCINFKSSAEFILAGTRVYDAKVITRQPRDRGEVPVKMIQFKIADTNQRIRIKFKKRWHPGVKIEDYLEKMFTTQNFEALTQDLYDHEINAIRKGVLVEGMSKKAVLISYGPPPEHRTPNLANYQWVYWTSTVAQKTICFDDYERTVSCKALKHL